LRLFDAALVAGKPVREIVLEAPHGLNDFGFGAGVAAHWIGEAQTYVNPPPPRDGPQCDS
jgi:hypothetical protein